MQNPFKMLGDVNQMRKQAQIIQQALEKEEYEISENGIRIVITGNQNVKSINIDGTENESVKKAINSAIKKSQQAAAGKLAEISKMMG